MDNDNSPPVDPWDLAESLEDYCYNNNDKFSIEGLREQLDRIPKNVIKDVVQWAKMLCSTPNVSVEVIECLLEYHPEAISSKCIDETSYPLHYACQSTDCAHDVIEFLMEKHPAVLRQFSVIYDEGVDTSSTYIGEDVYGYEDSYQVSGLPSHYYLSRPTKDIDMKTVIMLVNTYPESITKPCENTGLKPIDILLSRGIFREFRTYCTSTKPVTIDGLRERINKIPHEFYNHVQEHFSILQMICSNENVAAFEVVEYLLKEYDTNGASRAIDTRYSNDPSIAYPLHFACKNKSCPNSTIQLLMERYPAALSHVSVIDKGVRIDHPRLSDQYRYIDISGIPLHYYLSREENVDLETVKRMVELYPNALLGSENAWFDSVLHAPLDILLMNPSVDNSFEVAQSLIETNLDSIRRGVGGGDSSLHIACSSYMVDPRTIKSIIDACPNLIQCQNQNGETPIHCLVISTDLHDCKVEVLASLVEKDPVSLQIPNASGLLPIHEAASKGESPQICKILTDGYEGSTRVSLNGTLPLHSAAYMNNLDTAKFLFDADPTTLDTQDRNGKLFFRNEFIERNRNSHTKSFLEAQWPYYVQAKKEPVSLSSLTRRDEVGQVLLHHALYDKNVSLGSIKMLLEASPDSLFIADNDGTMPLHVACAFKPADIVEYLIDYFATSFGEERRPNIMIKKDKWGNTPLHYACHYGKCDVVKLLLENGQDSASVSERNDDDKLPIQLLFSETPRFGLHQRIDTISVEYTEALWLLLRNCPETVVNW